MSVSTLPSWVTTLPGGGGGGGGGGSGGGILTHAIVVGNSVEGDTASEVDFLDVGEWFEADVFTDPEGTVTQVSNVDRRPDYRLASCEQIDEFFRRRESGLG